MVVNVDVVDVIDVLDDILDGLDTRSAGYKLTGWMMSATATRNNKE